MDKQENEQIIKLYNLATMLAEAKNYKDDLKFQLKENEESIKNLQEKMVELMVELDIPNISRNGQRFSVVVKENYGPIIEKKQEFYDAMKENGYEHLFTINSQTQASVLKEIINNYRDGNELSTEMPEWLDGLINTYERSVISVTKSK